MSGLRVLPFGAALLVLGTVQAGAGESERERESRVRSCAQYGPGFVGTLGGSSCVKLGGRARAQADVVSARMPERDRAAFGANARVNLDVRTETPYGPARTFVRIQGGAR